MITTSPTFTKPEEKKTTINLNVKSPVKPQAKTTKKIDMGAATHFGKGTADSGIINSPTHRNTHNEVFVSSNKNRNEILEDIFSSSSAAVAVAGDDDFNPRAEETHEFGDFESAFGKPSAAQVPVQVAASGHSEFADFSSAFSGPPPASNTLIDDSSFLFEAPKPATTAAAAPPLPSLDLFGSNILNNNTQPKSDLLDDFGGLSLGGSGEYYSLNIISCERSLAFISFKSSVSSY